MENTTDRIQMCYEYMKELDQFRAKPVQNESRLRMLSLGLYEESIIKNQWLRITSGSEEVGFLVINPSVSYVDIQFEHCYVRPEFRRQGLSRHVHDAFIAGYGFPAVYASVLFDQNAGEKAFIDQLIVLHGGCYISDPIPTRHPELWLYRFLLTR